ncbi:MAG: WYL domain-containing protein [Candidatus Omnitrophica bacterium]|nr:WYL domain-containing protein [Candidatus Omnitrophota bacterium]
MKTREKDYSKKVFRLIYILNKLDTKKKVLSWELAEEFNVSLRTVQRDIELLNRAGFPLMSMERGEHSFVEGFSLKKLLITEEEASLLSLFYEMAKAMGKNFEDSFRGILRKVMAKGAESPFYIKVPKGSKLNTQFPDMKALENAVEECRKIELYYLTQGREKWFRVDPLKVMFFDGIWYLLARVDGKDWLLKLRLENIRKLKALDKYFKIPKNLQTVLDESVNIWFSEKRDKKILLSIDKDAARFFKRKEYFPLQKIKKENKDGSLLIQATACQYMEVIPTILRWLPYIEIIKPKNLKQEIVEIAEKYLKKAKKG